MARIILLITVFFSIHINGYATVYYVRTDGSNGNNGLTNTAAGAFATIQKAHDVSVAGDTVLVADGNYAEVQITRSGTASGWITYKSINEWGAKVTNSWGDVFRIEANYIDVEGFDVTTPAVYGSGISIFKNTGAGNYHHVQVLNNYAHDCGQSGVQAYDNDYITVEGNTCVRNGWLMPDAGSGISIYGGFMADTGTGYHFIVRNNICYLNDNGPATAQTDGNGIIIDDQRNTQDWHTGAATAGAFTGRILVENNLCYRNGAKGIQLFLTDNVTCRNNTCYGNNTRQDGGTWSGELNTSAASNCSLYNNICVTTISIGNGIFSGAFGGDGHSEDLVFYNNITYSTHNPSDDAVGTENMTTTVVGVNGNQCGVNPLFADMASGDFHLQAGSPAIDAGTAAYGYPADDLDGNTRPAGGTPDMGCYEYGTTTTKYVRFSSASYTVPEDAGTIEITVTRAGNMTGSFEVSYSTGTGTAAPGPDFSDASGSLTFTNSTVTNTYTISIVDDDIAEGDETVTLLLSNPTDSAELGTPATATLTIRDNDYDLSSPLSIWSGTDTPGTPADGDDASVELGLRFRSAVAGHISAVRFYKGATNTGTHVGNLWSTAGANLGTVTFTGETASGWQEQAFNSPVAIEADTEYIISYFAPNGHYAADAGAFSSGSISNGPLEAVNSVYKYGSSSVFPDETYGNTNYWVDVVFSASSGISNGPDALNGAVITPDLVISPQPATAANGTIRFSTTAGAVLESVELFEQDGTLAAGALVKFGHGNVEWNTAGMVPGVYIVKAVIDGQRVFSTLTLVD